MDIEDVVTTDYETVEAATRVSKLLGLFSDRKRRAVVVTRDDDFAGVVAQRQLLASHHDPKERVRTVMRTDPSRLSPTEDVRETARLMIESELKLLPVFEGDDFVGVVTARDILAAVQPNLDVLDVADVCSRNLVAVETETTLGEVLHTIREHGISHVPVLDETQVGGRIVERPLGMVSIYDLLSFVLRATEREQGGSPRGFDNHGGSGSRDTFRSHGGFGERAGFEARLLDLPARDVMSAPAATTTAEASLADATGEMFDNDYASLVVVDDDEQATGIVTMTDVLRSLTWTDEEPVRIQIFGIDLLTGMTREDVANMVAEVDGKYEAMDVIEAYVVLHQHKEQLRGMPLIRATIRLFTDRGRFAGTGEAYGAAPALRQARDCLERNVLDDKELVQVRARSGRTAEETERLLGWWLET